MAAIIGKDFYGQPIILFRIRKITQDILKNDKMKRFVVYLLEETARNMDKELGKYIIIADMKGAGLSNFNMKQVKEMSPIFQVRNRLATRRRIATQKGCTRCAS